MILVITTLHCVRDIGETIRGGPETSERMELLPVFARQRRWLEWYLVRFVGLSSESKGRRTRGWGTLKLVNGKEDSEP